MGQGQRRRPGQRRRLAEPRRPQDRRGADLRLQPDRRAGRLVEVQGLPRHLGPLRSGQRVRQGPGRAPSRGRAGTSTCWSQSSPNAGPAVGAVHRPAGQADQLLRRQRLVPAQGREEHHGRRQLDEDDDRHRHLAARPARPGGRRWPRTRPSSPGSGPPTPRPTTRSRHKYVKPSGRAGFDQAVDQLLRLHRVRLRDQRRPRPAARSRPPGPDAVNRVAVRPARSRTRR